MVCDIILCNSLIHVHVVMYHIDLYMSFQLYVHYYNNLSLVNTTWSYNREEPTLSLISGFGQSSSFLNRPVRSIIIWADKYNSNLAFYYVASKYLKEWLYTKLSN